MVIYRYFLETVKTDVKVSARIANRTELLIFGNTKNGVVRYCTVLCRILKSTERNVGLVPRHRHLWIQNFLLKK